MIADNRLALDAGGRRIALAELAELSESGYDLTMTGFSNEEIEELLVGAEQALRTARPTPTDDAADDVPRCAIEPGIASRRCLADRRASRHLWRCHRTGRRPNADGRRASGTCFTSPPYGNQRDYIRTPSLTGMP